MLKRAGARQLFAVAGPLVRVEWYPSLAAAVRGLEKNSLAAVGYSLPTLIGGSIGQLLLISWPFAAVFVTGGPTRALNLAAVLVIVATHALLLRGTSLRPWTALALPVGFIMLVFTTVRSALVTRLRGGVSWRGTFYSLDELRGGRARD